MSSTTQKALDKPKSLLDGKDLGTLSTCSTRHWRHTGAFSMTHEIKVTSLSWAVQYQFVPEEFSDRSFSVDMK